MEATRGTSRTLASGRPPCPAAAPIASSDHASGRTYRFGAAPASQVFTRRRAESLSPMTRQMPLPQLPSPRGRGVGGEGEGTIRALVFANRTEENPHPGPLPRGEGEEKGK